VGNRGTRARGEHVGWKTSGRERNKSGESGDVVIGVP